MKDSALPRDKYFLRDLHQEIDLYDRKLAYLDKFVHFALPADRKDAQQRLLRRRAPLEKTARQLAASGVEYHEKDLPRSFRTNNPDQGSTRRNLVLVKRAEGFTEKDMQ